MRNKIIATFICMLIVTVTISAGNSIEPINNIEQYAKNDSNDDCGCNNDQIIDKTTDFFYNYPTMKEIIFLDPTKASPKPEIMQTPTEFSWLDFEGQDWTTPAKKQLCGDCWDFAACGSLESTIKIREGCARLNPDLSEQYVLSCLPNAGSCHGGNPIRALQLMMENTSEGNYYNGALLESCFPYQGNDDVPCDDKCPDWVDYLVPLLNCGYFIPDGSSEDREAIKSQIMLTGPVVAGIKATRLFQLWGGINHNPASYFHFLRNVVFMNHVVLLVGWKDDPAINKGGYWICKNSWGSAWGYNGFFNIEYNALGIDSSLIVWADYDPTSFNWAPVADAGGVYIGDIGHDITFDAGGSFDPEGDIVLYHWDFGDGANGTGLETSHSYAQQGIYKVILTVYDAEGKTGQDDTWAAIDEPFDAPEAPIITGPLKGVPGVTYNYTFVATDPNGDDVYLWVEWGTYSSTGGWIGPFASGEEVTLNYTWKSKGAYNLKAKAKDSYGLESDWGTLQVTMPRIMGLKDLFFLGFLEKFPRAFPIIRYILKI